MKKILFMVVVLIFISGCPQQSSNFNPNAGAVIQDLSFDADRVYDDDTATLMFDVANVGGKKIPKDGVKVYVYGPRIDTTGKNVWRLRDSTPTAKVISGYISTSISSIDLPPPDQSTNALGGMQSFNFEFDPPDIIDGMEATAEFHVSLCYPYATEVLSQIEVTSKNELRSTGVQGSKKDAINAGGPIHISIEATGNLRTDRKMPILLRITDVGGGYPMLNYTECSIDIPTENRNIVAVSLTVDGSTDNIECDSSTVTLTKGEGAMYCKYTPTRASTPRRTYMVKAVAEYNYYLTKEASITNVDSSL